MPEGYQKCFYQKHVNEKPPAVGRIEIEEENGRDTYMLAESLEALLGLVQMGVLEIHTWGSLKDKVERPDRLIFDLDPDPSVPWRQVIEAAQLTKALLEELGFVTFLKTTGGKGLHIVTPIQRTLDWEEAKGFAKMVADHLVSTIPQRFTSNMSKRARKEKYLLIIFGQCSGRDGDRRILDQGEAGAPPVSRAHRLGRAFRDAAVRSFPRWPTCRPASSIFGKIHGKTYDKSARRVTADMKARLKSGL